MHSTKSEILAILKRHDGSTVDEFASSLNLAPMTVRQHLMALERDGLVHVEEVRRATGRPHFRYRLSAEGHRHVADGHDRLLAALVDEIGRLDAGDLDSMSRIGETERRGLLFRRAAEHLAERHRAEVRGLSGASQYDAIVHILRKHGGFPEWHETPDGIELRDFACVYRSTVGTEGRCEWHEPFLAELLDAPVRVADGATECADCCRYVIPVTVGAHAAARRAF